MVYHQLSRLSGDGYCSSRHIKFLVCHVIKQHQVIKSPVDYNDNSPSRYVTIPPDLVVIGTVVVQV